MRTKRHMRMRYKYDDSGEPYAPADQQAEELPVHHELETYPDRQTALDAATVWRGLVVELRLARFFGVGTERIPGGTWWRVYAEKQPTAGSFDLSGWLSENSGGKLRLRLVSHGTHRA